jgi:hypothetical protein
MTPSLQHSTIPSSSAPVPFCTLPVGALFAFRDHRYQKTALSMATDDERIGNIFMDHVPVIWDRRPGEQPRPAPKPDPRHWTEYLVHAPG